MLAVAPIDPVAKGVLADPTPTDLSKLSLSPDLPPPPPPGNGDSDGKDGDDGYLNYGITLSQPTQSRTTSTLDIISASTSTTSSNYIVSPTSRAQATSSSESSPSTSESSDSAQITFFTLITSTTSQSQTSSESAAISSTSISTTMSIFSTSEASPTGTALPIGQNSHGLEVKAGSSPLTTAGIVLASIFGAIALVTVIYLLYRFRRRKSQQSQLADNEKQHPYTSTTQETGIIFGRRGGSSDPRTMSNPYAQRDEQTRTHGRGRLRFSFLNRRWYSTGTQISDPQLQIQGQQIPRQAEEDTLTAAPASPQRWPSPFFFTRNFPFAPHPHSHSHSHSTTQRYPPPSTRTPTSPPHLQPLHLNPTTEINRTTSTRTNASATSQPGSGHARAYAHHGIATPRFSMISAARSTISSISSRWLGGGGGGVEVRRSGVSLPSSLGASDELISPISSTSEYRGRSSTLLPSPLRVDRSRLGVGGYEDRMSTMADAVNSQGRRESRGRERVGRMPRLPLPVVVSRGSWGRMEV